MPVLKVFVSYSREDAVAAEALANDIRALGYVAWFDQELAGGQAWWNEILASIRNSDAFVFVLTPQSLSSTACVREYSYAAALGRPILPVLVAEGVSTNLLPPALSQLHFIDCRDQNRTSALRLARALGMVAPGEPLPDPLPEPPEVPISYLGDLSERIERASTLSYEQQSALIVDLKRGLRDPAAFDDSLALLGKLRRRRDLLATIGDEVDEMLKTVKLSAAPRIPAEAKEPLGQRIDEALPNVTGGGKLQEQGQESTGAKVLASAGSGPSSRERIASALIGAAVGTAIGLLAMSSHGSRDWEFGLLTGAGFSIAGAISGRRTKVIVPAIVVAAVAWVACLIFFSPRQGVAIGGVFGAPGGAILGAVIGAVRGRARVRSKATKASGVA
jgi:hypothetical protein